MRGDAHRPPQVRAICARDALQAASLSHTLGILVLSKVPEMISYLSDYFELAAGDVILSGTPSGVGPVARGDVMTVSVEGLGSMEVSVT